MALGIGLLSLSTIQATAGTIELKPFPLNDAPQPERCPQKVMASETTEPYRELYLEWECGLGGDRHKDLRRQG
jgi:hypothetical protein